MAATPAMLMWCWWRSRALPSQRRWARSPAWRARSPSTPPTPTPPATRPSRRWRRRSDRLQVARSPRASTSTTPACTARFQPSGHGPAASTPPTARPMRPPGSSSPTPATTRSGLAGWTRPVPWRISPGCCSPPPGTVPPSFTASRRPASCEQDQHQRAEVIRTFARLRAHGHHPRLLLAAAMMAADCGTSQGPSAGPYGPAPSSASRARAMTAGGPTLRARHTALGTILTTGRGFTVYAFEADQGIRSACFGACAAAWPPVTITSTRVTVADGAARSLVGQTTRPGGQRQLTYARHPLYTFAGDTSPGTTNGQGLDAFGARWDVLLPGGKEVSGG